MIQTVLFDQCNDTVHDWADLRPCERQELAGENVQISVVPSSEFSYLSLVQPIL